MLNLTFISSNIQNGGVVFASVISHIPLTVALATNLVLDYTVGMGIGLAIAVAAVRLLFVIQVGKCITFTDFYQDVLLNCIVLTHLGILKKKTLTDAADNNV